MRLLLHQFCMTLLSERGESNKTNANKILLKASYKAPLTRKIRLQFGHKSCWITVEWNNLLKKIWPERTRQNHNFCWRSVLHINADLGWIRKSSVMYWRNIRMVSWVDASISLLCLEHHKGCIIFYYTRHLPMNIRFSLLWPSLVWPVFLRFECY